MTKVFSASVVIIIVDLLIALFAFWFSRFFVEMPRWNWLLLSAAIWVAFGLVTRKLSFGEYKRSRYALLGILVIDIIAAAIIFLVFKYFVPGYEYDYSIIVAATIIFFLEYILYYTIRLFVYCKIPYFYEEGSVEDGRCEHLEIEEEDIANDDLLKVLERLESDVDIEDGFSTVNFSGDVVILDTANPEAILPYAGKHPKLVIHNRILNYVRHINTLLAYTNYAMDDKGYIVCCCVTSEVRRARILKESPSVIGKVIYFFDYFIHRVFSKLTVTNSLYYWITKGERRVLTRVEVLGRIYRAGYDVVQEHVHDNNFYVVAKKIKEPIRDDKPSNGLLIRLRRKGKNGKIVGVYKFRTMHAYSEYLQPYIYKTGGLCEGGKFADDYRVNAAGKIMRKAWIDELPMIINWIKGDLKIVGVRPLSNHYFSLYSKELQELRVKVKPGLLPPFYADMPKTLDQIQESEKCYIKAYLKSPWKTDFIYFFRCVNNIIFKGKRSK